MCKLSFGEFLFLQESIGIADTFFNANSLNLALFDKHVVDEFAVHCIFHKFFFWDVSVPILVHCGSERVRSSPKLIFILYTLYIFFASLIGIIWSWKILRHGSKIAIIKLSLSSYFPLYGFGKANIKPDILSAGVKKILVLLNASQVEQSNHDVPDNHDDDGDDDGGDVDDGIMAMLAK